MKSISGKNWEETNVSRRLVEKLIIDNNFSEILSKLIISRNFSSTEIYSIKNQIDFRNPFFRNKDFLSACEILKRNIDLKNKILVIVDYDVDGCVSTSLIANFLKKISVNHEYYIPDRIKDGYGASKDLLIKLINEKNPRLIFFLDNGSNSYETIKYLKSIKIESIIIDHHNINKPYPKSNALINPKKDSNYKEYDYLCSAFLTYLFIDIYIKKNDLKISQKDNLIYVLLAVVADVMPLRGINRFLGKNLLETFDINKDQIISYLFKLNKIKKKLELDDLGFFLGPIFNSAGRIDDANQIVELLTTNSSFKKRNILEKINSLNLKRKKIENQYFDKINLNAISKEDGIIYIYEPYLPEGIIGIIASKLKEHFNKPCVILTKSGNKIKGSARSTLGFNIGEYIHKALQQKILLSGGGHNLAAGLSMLKTNIKLFKIFLNNLYKKNASIEISNYISKLSLSRINKVFMDEINLLSPFGNGNPAPYFLIENVKIIKPLLLKKKFISCFIKSNNKLIKAISFNPINSKISLNLMNYKNEINIISRIKQNKWNNKNSIQLEVIDVIR